MGNVNMLRTGEPVGKQEGQLGHMAPYYDLVMALFTAGRDRTLRRMTVAQARLMPGDRVLEIGSGTGSLSLAARERTGQHCRYSFPRQPF